MFHVGFLSICKWCRMEKNAVLLLIMFCLVYIHRNTQKDTWEQTVQKQEIQSENTFLGSLAAKHKTRKQSGRFKFHAKRAPVNNLIPKRGFLNNVSLGCIVFFGLVSEASTGQPAVCVSITLLYHIFEKLDVSCSLCSHSAFEYEAKSDSPLFKNTLQHDHSLALTQCTGS